MRKQASKRLIIAAAVAMMAALHVAAASPAGAYVSQANVTATTMITNELSTTDAQGPVRATLPITVSATNAMHNLRAQIVVANPSSGSLHDKVMVGLKITCINASTGAAVPDNSSQNGYVWTTQNVLTGSTTTIYARMLFKPGAAGSYKCQLRAYASDFDGNAASASGSISLVSGFIGDIDGEISSGKFVFNRAGTATTLIGLGVGKQLYPTTFTPPAGATSFTAVGDFHVTTCYSLSSCAGGPFPDGVAKIYHRLVATPSITTGACGTLVSSGATATTPVTESVSWETHHATFHQTLQISGMPSGGCGTWTINIYVKSDTGGTDAFEVDGDPYNTLYARPYI